MTNDEPCPTCGSNQLRLKWQPIADGRLQIAARCLKCGRFRLWWPQTPEAIAEANASEPASTQPGLFD